MRASLRAFYEVSQSFTESMSLWTRWAQSRVRPSTLLDADAAVIRILRRAASRSSSRGLHVADLRLADCRRTPC